MSAIKLQYLIPPVTMSQFQPTVKDKPKHSSGGIIRVV